MNKIILIFLCVSAAVPAFAQLNRNNKNFDASVGISMVYAYQIPNPYGAAKQNTINTVNADVKYKYIDFFGYIDIYDAFFLFDNKPYVFGHINNYLFGELNPRVSFSDMTGYNLSYGIFGDLLLSYNFTFDSDDLLQHYMGIGVDLNIPLFSYLKLNIYARYNQKYYNRNENRFDGYMFNVSYEIPIYKFSVGIDIVYSGWLKYVFDAKPSGIPNERNYSIHWKNYIKIGYKGFSIGYSYQMNENFMELRSHTSGSDEQTVGIYYTYTFR